MIFAGMHVRAFDNDPTPLFFVSASRLASRGRLVTEEGAKWELRYFWGRPGRSVNPICAHWTFDTKCTFFMVYVGKPYSFAQHQLCSVAPRNTTFPTSLCNSALFSSLPAPTQRVDDSTVLAGLHWMEGAAVIPTVT
jgi:hypothetical protein